MINDRQIRYLEVCMIARMDCHGWNVRILGWNECAQVRILGWNECAQARILGFDLKAKMGRCYYKQWFCFPS